MDMTRRKLKLKVRPKLPGKIVGGVGLTATTSGLVTSIDLDFTELTPANDTNGLRTIAFDPSTGQYYYTPPPAGFTATSATSLEIATGTVNFTTQQGLAYRPGQRIRLVSQANAANYMEGDIVSYSGDAMSVAISLLGPDASGTFADWNIVIAGNPGSGDMLSTNYGSEYAGHGPEVLTNLGAGTTGKALVAAEDYGDAINIINLFCSSRTALAALDTTNASLVWLSEGGRSGLFKWFGADQSSKVAPRAIVSTGVDSTADTITSAGHRLKTGDALLSTTAVNGVAVNTIYYAIRSSSSVLSLASSFANAIAGTKVDLTGTTGMTLKTCPDWMQGEVIIPTGLALDGSQGAWLRQKPRTGEYNSEHFGLEIGGTNDNSPTLRGMSHVMEEFGGGKAELPSGIIYLSDQILARRNVYVFGTGKHSTILDWHASSSSYLIDGRDDGTDGVFPYDRTFFSFCDLKIDGTNLGGSTTIRGVGVQGNYRSPPLLCRVWLCKTTSQGIWFDGDNWNIDFVDVEVDTCARVAGAGVGNNPAIVSLNHINFTRVRVEGCGNSSSPPTAGGFYLNFTSAGPRGFNFTDCQSEGNFGTDENFFNNVTGLKLDGFYVETNNNGGTGATNRAGIEMTNCTANIVNAECYAQSGGNAKKALKVNGTSRVLVGVLNVGDSWATATIETNDSSAVKYGFVSAVGGTVTLTNNGTSTITAI